MRVGDSYDLIVIGDQLSGLFLAVGAAQRGMKVLVLEESDFPTVLYETPSGRLLGDYLAEPAAGIREGSVVDAFLQSLGLYQELDQLFARHEPPLQVVAPGFRLDFPYDPSFGAGLAREVQLPPDRLEGLRALLAGDATAGRRTFSQAAAERGLPVGYECLGHLQAELYGSLLPADLAYADYRDLLQRCSAGVRFPLGGRGAVKERLLSRLQVCGGSLRRASHVEEIVFERRRLTGVLLSSYEGFVRSPRVVGAMAAHTFAGLVPPEMRSRRLEAAVKRVRPRGWKLGFTLLVPEAVLPEGLGSHVALVDPDAAPGGEGVLQLQVFPKDFYGGIPPRHRAILGRLVLPYTKEALSPRAIAIELRRALARIETVVPFLRDQPFSVFPDPAALERDPVFQRYYSFSDLEHIPGSLLVYEHAFGDSLSPQDALDWSAFGLPGVAFCSRDIRPLHGILGEITAAMELLRLWEPRRAARPDASAAKPRTDARA